MRKSKTKKAKVDEVTKLINDFFNNASWTRAQAKRRVRGLVRKAYKLGENERYIGFCSDHFTTAERFQIMFGVKP